MDEEILLIDLLAEKNLIKTFLRDYLKKRLSILAISTILISFIFFGLNKIMQLFLINQGDDSVYNTKITQLNNFSRGLGIYIVIIFSLAILMYIADYFFTIKRFHQFLQNKIEPLNHLEILEEDSSYLYFINNQEIKETPTKRSILKKSIKTIPLSENGRSVIIGQSRSIFLLYRIYFLLEPEEPINQITKRKSNIQNNIIYSVVILVICFSMISYFYLTGNLNPSSRNDINQVISITSSEAVDIQDGELLIANNNNEFSGVSDLEMTYHYDTREDLLLQTTNYGKEWIEVPIKASDTRRGFYSLTSGTILDGYFMDNTYDISPEFSWYLYSPEPTKSDKLNLHFLKSVDNGRTWHSYFIGEVSSRVRYRKVQRLSSGLMMVFVSTPTDMSEEGVTIHKSNDEGDSWEKTIDTSLSSPLQNASFISESIGFLATRSSIFYTSNGGISFDESLINFPDDYTSNGLDLFTSPNEVNQKTANTLSIRLNLVKSKGLDAENLFECEFLSTDNGATWNFEKQIKPITLE